MVDLVSRSTTVSTRGHNGFEYWESLRRRPCRSDSGLCSITPVPHSFIASSCDKRPVRSGGLRA